MVKIWKDEIGQSTLVIFSSLIKGQDHLSSEFLTRICGTL